MLATKLDESFLMCGQSLQFELALFSNLIIILVSLVEFPIAVVDHGTANVEIAMEEALQEFPPLIHDIKEKLRC